MEKKNYYDYFCEFCEIKNKINEKIIFKNNEIFAFKDISLDSAVDHILVCPFEHIENVNYLKKSHFELLDQMLKNAIEICKKLYPTKKKEDFRYFNYFK